MTGWVGSGCLGLVLLATCMGRAYAETPIPSIPAGTSKTFRSIKPFPTAIRMYVKNECSPLPQGDARLQEISVYNFAMFEPHVFVTCGNGFVSWTAVFRQKQSAIERVYFAQGSPTDGFAAVDSLGLFDADPKTGIIRSAVSTDVCVAYPVFTYKPKNNNFVLTQVEEFPCEGDKGKVIWRAKDP